MARKISFWIYGLFLIVALSFVTACDDDDDDDELVGNWVELSPFDGLPRNGAVGFSIGSKGYLGTGYDGDDRLNDFWEYDPSRNAWTQKADFPGVPRNSAVAFSASGKGYVGTGYDGDNKLNDFYEYNPSTNQWTQIADFGGSPRYSAVAFSIDDIGYVGTGYDGNYNKDFWTYDPATGVWKSIISLGGKKRRDAVGFSIDGKGYVCTGIDNGTYLNDMWEYDTDTKNWIRKNYITDYTDEDFDDDYTSITGIDKVAFTVNHKGYLATGGQGSVGTIVWEYDPVTDLWIEKTEFEGSARIDAVAFSIGDRGYVMTGRSSSYYFYDIWAFDPDDEYEEYD